MAPSLRQAGHAHPVSPSMSSLFRIARSICFVVRYQYPRLKQIESHAWVFHVHPSWLCARRRNEQISQLRYQAVTLNSAHAVFLNLCSTVQYRGHAGRLDSLFCFVNKHCTCWRIRPSWDCKPTRIHREAESRPCPAVEFVTHVTDMTHTH